MRQIQFHDELEWPENPTVSRHLESLVKRAQVIRSPLNFRELVRAPNSVFLCSTEQAKRMAPSLYPLSTNKNFQILDNKDEQLSVCLPNVLHEAWGHPESAHPDCTLDNMQTMIHAALDKI